MRRWLSAFGRSLSTNQRTLSTPLIFKMDAAASLGPAATSTTIIDRAACSGASDVL